jgi:hypothetical protein
MKHERKSAYNLEEELLVKPGKRLGSRDRTIIIKISPPKTDNGKLIAANRRVTDRNSTGIRKVVTGIVQNLQTIQQIKTRKDKVIDQLSYFRFIRSLSCCCCLYYYNPRMKMIQVPSNSTEWDGYLL